MRNWTPSQRLAIDTQGRDLLLSAGAGAGKTAVLVERIVARCTDPLAPWSLDDFLIITFTRAAADEMRVRIRAALERALDNVPADGEVAEHLEGELRALPSARISTIHSFCMDVLTAHGAAIGLPPGFTIIGEEEAILQRRATIAAALEDALADPARADIATQLVRATSPSASTEPLAQLVDRTIAHLEGTPAPDHWCAEAIAPWRDAAAALNPLDSVLGARLRERFSVLRESVLAHTEAFLAYNPGSAKSRVDFLSAVRGFRAVLARTAELGAAGEELASAARTLRAQRGPLGKDDPLVEEWRERKDAFRSQLEEIAAAAATDWSTWFRRREAALVELLQRLGAALLQRLDARCRSERRLTFSMLERETLRLFVGERGAPTDAARAYAASVREILVDEFQDVNPVQAAIVASLRDCKRPGASLHRFAVGDVKQSIYGFRQADPDIFLGELDRAGSVEASAGADSPGRIILGENFRSAHALLQEFNVLFERLFSPALGGIDYAALHRLVPARPAPSREGTVWSPRLELHVFTREDLLPVDDEESEEDQDEALRGALEREAACVADSIASLGLPWGDITVLLRSFPRAVEALQGAFADRAIPCIADAAEGLLSAPEIQEVLAILRCTESPFDEVALLGALRGPAGGWTEDMLLRLAALDRRIPFIDRLERAAKAGPLADAATSFLRRHALWQANALRMPMGQLLSTLYDELDLLDAASVKPGGDRRRLRLLFLLDRAEQFDSFERKGLREFLRFLEDLLKRGEDLGRPPAEESEPNAVRIVSIHQSKGRQYPVVVLPFTGRPFNRRDLNARLLLSRESGVAARNLWWPPTNEWDPIGAQVQESLRRRQLGEELRLLYVALTRAEEIAIVTGTIGKPLTNWLDARRGSSITDESRLAANCYLDWMLLDAEARLAGTPLSLDMHERAGAWHLRVAALPETTLAARIGASLPTDQDVAPYRDAIERLERENAQTTLPKIRAKISVTEAKRAHDAFPDSLTPRAKRPRATVQEFVWRPKPDGHERNNPRLRGTATHRFLALCDFEELSRGRALEEERERLVQMGLLSASEAAGVYLQEIGEFLNTPFGGELRLRAGTLRREVPFTVAVDPATVLGAGAGRIPERPIVLQGVIDGYFRDARGGIVVLDYKTDFAGRNGERADALAEGYRAQMVLYADGLSRALGEPVARCVLVFLRAGCIVPVPTKAPTAEEWQLLLAPGVLLDDGAAPRPPLGAKV